MDDEVPGWRLYERFVASLYSSKATDDVTVTPNAVLTGAISGVRRQIDVLIDARIQEDVGRRVIVDAKYWKRKVDVTDVEAFEAMMRDCRAQRGILVCGAGFTEGAKRRAQEQIGLTLIPAEDLESIDLTDWEACLGECMTPSSRRARKGWVLYDQPFGLTAGDVPFAVFVLGKCDECRNFHVWCWTCGTKFALGDEAEHHCGCNWFWLTAIEDEGPENSGLQAVLLLLVVLPGKIFVADRRPLA